MKLERREGEKREGGETKKRMTDDLRDIMKIDVHVDTDHGPPMERIAAGTVTDIGAPDAVSHIVLTATTPHATRMLPTRRDPENEDDVIKNRRIDTETRTETGTETESVGRIRKAQNHARREKSKRCVKARRLLR